MRKVFEIGGRELALEWTPEVFEPNFTTRKIADALPIKAGGSYLDLGCGIGPLGIYAALSGASRVVCADVDEVACNLARNNARFHGVDAVVDVREGFLFEAVSEKFDVIINDVSGVAEAVARLSPWYPPTIHCAGEDGTDLTQQVLSRAPPYLKPKGLLLFPLLSLAAEHKLRAAISAIYGDKFMTHASYNIPFPPQLNAAIDLLEGLRERNIISFEKKGSRYRWHLHVCSVTIG